SALAPASAEQIAASGAVAGYASPVGLAVQTIDDRRKTIENDLAVNGAVSSIVHRPSSGVFVIAAPSVMAGPLVAGAKRCGDHPRNVVYGRDWQATLVADIAAVRAGDACARCGAGLTLERGVEIGHIFKLGTRYTEAFGATYLDLDGAAKPIVMGSYGI